MMDSTTFLYHTVPGRLLLPLLTDRRLSQICGDFLDSPASAFLIPLFVRKAGIDLSQFHTDEIRCFNDCFSRRIKEGLRPIDPAPDSLIAPCDGLLQAFHVRQDTVLQVKAKPYTLTSLLRNRKLAEKYEGGTCLVFRLCVEHYHRYCYIETGHKSRNVFIPGCLHTVRPAALSVTPVFTENCREYTLIRTENKGTILQMEIGAMLVGRISNHDQEADVKRGEEKGCFEYGGSTILVLLQAGSAVPDARYFEAAERGEEVPVRMGQRISP